MTPEEIQRIWDEQLIFAWSKYSTMRAPIYGFTKRAAPILYRLADLRRMLKYIASLNLKRCPWITEKEGKITTYPWKCQARAFVADHSPQLSGAMWSEKFDNNDIIDNIDNYKWFKKASVNKARDKETRDEMRRKRTVRSVSMRAGDKNHDWSTVK